MATNAAIHLLTSWGFSEEVIGHFIAEEIEADQFNSLTEEDLKILIPNIGPRRKFQNNLKNYLDEIAQRSIENVGPNNQQPQATQQDFDDTNVSIKRQKRDTRQQYYNEDNKLNGDNNISSITENISPTLPSASSTSASTGNDVIFLTNNATSATEIKQYTATDNKYDLESILKKSEIGQLLLSLYKNEGRLNNDQRNKLAKIIVSNELSPNISNKIRSERASFLSDRVIQLFPTEDKSVWYIKKKKGESQGKGKIQTQCYCIRRKLKAGLLNVKATADFIHVHTDNEESDDNVMNYEEYMLWLKNNCRPWQILTEYWSLTSKKRLKDLQTNNNHKSCHEYMIQFPALSDPLGYVLLEKDFETLYPGRNLKLYVAWPKISNFVTNKMTSKLKNHFDNVFTPDGVKIVTLFLMPHLFPVNTIKNKAQNWRPSRKESEEGFLLHVNTIADLETKLQKRATKLQSFGQPSLPVAVIIGPSFDEIKQCFVVINTFRYEVETPLKAVDLVFKSCNALNVRYPLEVGQLFMFLQRAVYEFETLWDKQKNSQLTSSVLATIQEYKSLKS